MQKGKGNSAKIGTMTLQEDKKYWAKEKERYQKSQRYGKKKKHQWYDK
jgi:hypothetical protein